MRQITTRAELVALAKELRVRVDWHEPDEQDITAVPAGDPLNFDNAMPPGHYYGPNGNRSELHVVLHRMVFEDGERRLAEPIAVVNLASLFAWATGHQLTEVESRCAEEVQRLEEEIVTLRSNLEILSRDAMRSRHASVRRLRHA